MYIYFKNGEKVYIDLNGYCIESVYDTIQKVMGGNGELYVIKGTVLRCEDILYVQFDDDFHEIIDCIIDNEDDTKAKWILEEMEKHGMVNTNEKMFYIPNELINNDELLVEHTKGVEKFHNLGKAAKGLQEILKEEYDPHTRIEVTSNGVTVISEQLFTPAEEVK